MIPELPREDLEAIFRGDDNNSAALRYAMYPLLSPGMPPPGPDFMAHAQALEDAPQLTVEGKGKTKQVTGVGFMLNCLYLRCLYDNDFYIPVKVKKKPELVRVIPGHLWGGAPDGPKYLSDEELRGQPRVMIIGKMPKQEELNAGRNLAGPGGELLRDTLIAAGIDEYSLDDWYVCNLIRWANPNTQGNAIPSEWIKDCLPLLHQELRLCRPDYILCLGAEATKHVCGNGCNISNMIGRYVEIEVPLHELGEEPQFHKAKVMAVLDPSSVLRNTEQHPQFEATIRNFAQLSKKQDFTAKKEEVKWIAVTKERHLKEIVDYVLSAPGLKKIAVDGEWHGHHPGEPGSYLRTIQFSWDGRYAVVVVLRNAGGSVAFRPGIATAAAQLRRLLDRDDVQIGGSFFSADSPWLEYNGIPLAHRFKVPPDLNQVRGGNYAGGFDVALAHHAYNETGDYKLEVMGSRLCGAARWDVDLNDWKHRYLAEHKLKDEELGGYGECPSDILYPYGAKDAAYTRQLMDVHCELLWADRFGNDCWLPFYISMLAFPAFNEMGTVGLKIDPERIDFLTDQFQQAGNVKIAEMRQQTNWPAFNPRSPQQCVELLFGSAYSTKLDKDGNRVSVRPKGALTLNLTPVKSTGKGKAWGWVMARGEQDKYSPCTDKETCGILGMNNPIAMLLRDTRIVDQVLKSVFRPPKKKGNTLVLDADGRRIYGGGIAKYICHDQRVRSSFQQVKETGRASSARPPLQNISKKREDDYARILGELYTWPVRSFITSNTDPEYGELTVLVEADYKGAELMGMAVMSRDEAMLDHCLRANLPEEDPQCYDIHSNIAVRAFQLNCEPTKLGLKLSGNKGKRVAAKNIIFGVGYGRTAQACARQCQEEGAPITEAEAQQIIDTIFNTYPGIPRLQEALRARAHSPGWIKNCFGRLRRCIAASDRGAMGELERQFLNFPFQSMVADAVSYALHYLHTHPRKAELGYKVALQIHDAIVLEVPVRSLDIVYNEILPFCMVDSVPFKACDLNGDPFADSDTFRFGIDTDVFTRWGIALTVDECNSLGINPVYAHGA